MTENTDFAPPADPWALFAAWYALAVKSEPNNPDAMALASIGPDFMPSVRMVLMKSFDAGGVVFYTNHHSRKGEELLRHPKAAVCFYWKSLQRQVRIEGSVITVDDTESDAYFASRPRGSQIGAWASKQSQPLESREALEQSVADMEKKYEGREVPRPSNWGGFRLLPSSIEFWQERLYRLHDRVRYRPATKGVVYADDRVVYKTEATGNWSIERLYP